MARNGQTATLREVKRKAIERDGERDILTYAHFYSGHCNFYEISVTS
jgi:hypothetical protein